MFDLNTHTHTHSYPLHSSAAPSLSAAFLWLSASYVTSAERPLAGQSIIDMWDWSAALTGHMFGHNDRNFLWEPLFFFIFVGCEEEQSAGNIIYSETEHLPCISVFTPPGPLIRAAHRIKSSTTLHHHLPLCAQWFPACCCVMRELPLLFPCCSPVREGAVCHRVSHTWTRVTCGETHHFLPSDITWSPPVKILILISYFSKLIC